MDLRRRSYYPVYLLIAVMLAPWSADAQTYSFRHYSSADGLALSSINTIFQDSRGALWFGGIGGAFRYDGNGFVPYHTLGREHAVVTRFAEDDRGTVWIATEGHGVSKVPSGSDRSTEVLSMTQGTLPSDSVYALATDGHGTMAIGTRRGLLLQRSGGKDTVLTRRSGLASDWVRMTLFDRSGHLWVSTNGGVTRFTLTDGMITAAKPIHNAAVLSMILDPDGTVMMGTTEGREEANKGIFGVRGDSVFKVLDLKRFTDAVKTQALLRDDHGALWIGTGGAGVMVMDGGQLRRIRSAQGLVNEYIGCILQDADGSLWFATGKGALKLSRRHTLNYSETEGIAGLMTVLTTTNDTVWCGGFRSFSLILPDGTARSLHDVPEMKDRAVFSLVQDSRGMVWIATDKGIVSFNGAHFRRERIGSFPAERFVYSLTADHQEGIWIGYKGEILRLVGGRITESYGPQERIPDADISTLRSDRQGRLWFSADGHGGGMIVNGVVTLFDRSNGLPGNTIAGIMDDTGGRVWFITSEGTAYWKDGVFIPLRDDRFPLEHHEVTSVHEDRDHHLWFGTWFGVVEWSDSVLARYDTQDGLSGDVVQCIAEDRHGNLWIGTGGGLTKFPSEVRAVSIPVPDLLLARMGDNGRPAESRTVPYGERTVIFRATSLNFFDERTMEFQYRMEGVDAEWSAPTQQRTVRYTTLPSGEYRLLARARNRNGAWSAPVQVHFEVQPPFWKTWWFTVAVFFMVTGSGALLLRRRIRRLQEQAASQQRFSKQLIDMNEAERKRIASELHDGLGQNLLIIANRAKMGWKKEGTAAMQKEFDIISASALESIADLRKISYNLHPLQIDETGITAALEAMLKRIASAADVPVSYTVDRIDDLVPAAHRIHWYRLVQELLTNALKHSAARSIDVTVVQDDDTVRISVRDDGTGFDPAQQKEGYGMRSIHERVRILGGTITVDASQGNGTAVRIIVPAHRKEGA